MKKNWFLTALGVTLILMLFTNCALAYTATPYADTVFSSAKVSLSAQINASFTAQTKSKQAEIKVTSCILQIKTGSVWADSMTLQRRPKLRQIQAAILQRRIIPAAALREIRTVSRQFLMRMGIPKRRTPTRSAIDLWKAKAIPFGAALSLSSLRFLLPDLLQKVCLSPQLF